MFGLVQVKWFEFIPKQPKLLHPQPVHQGVLVHYGWSTLPIIKKFGYVINCPCDFQGQTNKHGRVMFSTPWQA